VKPMVSVSHQRGRLNRRRILIVLVVLAALPLVGASWQRLATDRDHRRYPPPGELVTVDDHGARLHLVTQGRRHRFGNPNTPVVLLDAGTPGFSAQWGWIQPAIAEFATVVAYDRPGLGWSEPRPGADPFDPRDTADRLHTALQKVGLPGPYLLVGHSYGGLTSRVFAAAYPDEISGIVLVDPSHPDQGSRAEGEGPAGSMWFMAPLARIGALRLGVATGMFASMIGDLPERQADEAAAIFVQPGQWSTVELELAAWSDIASRLEQAEPLGDLPLTVISAGTGGPDEHQLHAQVAGLSSRGSHQSLVEATHLSLLTDREHSRATVDAVQATLAACSDCSRKSR
jgi:pimeloyl-ACP methyl ester carboxylesterase